MAYGTCFGITRYPVTLPSKHGNEVIDLLTCDYKVISIDGDYAHLQRIDQPDDEPKLVARALLPMEIYEGCTLHYEMLQYEMK